MQDDVASGTVGVPRALFLTRTRSLRPIVVTYTSIVLKRLLGAMGLLLVCSLQLAAQAVDIIRGRVLGTDAQAIPNVLVTATTLSGNVSRTARTDKNGRYTISFPGGEGDYWVTFSAVGLGPRRYQVKRTADQEIL